MNSGRSKIQVALLLEVYDQAYEGRSWHGTNLKGAIRGLSSRMAGWRPGPDRHSIREIVLHAAYWKYAVWRRLMEERRGTFPIKGSNWIRRSQEEDETGWKQERALVDRFHRRLREVIASLTDDQLRAKPRGSRHSRATLLYGIASHDLYHAGQIQLLKRLHPRSR